MSLCNNPSSGILSGLYNYDVPGFTSGETSRTLSPSFRLRIRRMFIDPHDLLDLLTQSAASHRSDRRLSRCPRETRRLQRRPGRYGHQQVLVKNPALLMFFTAVDTTSAPASTKAAANKENSTQYGKLNIIATRKRTAPRSNPGNPLLVDGHILHALFVCFLRYFNTFQYAPQFPQLFGKYNPSRPVWQLYSQPSGGKIQDADLTPGRLFISFSILAAHEAHPKPISIRTLFRALKLPFPA